MIKLVQYVSYPTLCEQIVGQFAFMKAMSQPHDKVYQDLRDVSLDDIYKKAHERFIKLATFDILIEAEECNLSKQLTEFLKQWESITDVTAIQQNIHYQLTKLETK